MSRVRDDAVDRLLIERRERGRASDFVISAGLAGPDDDASRPIAVGRHFRGDAPDVAFFDPAEVPRLGDPNAVQAVPLFSTVKRSGGFERQPIHDVVGPDRRPLGWVRRDHAADLVRTTVRVGVPGLDCVGREANVPLGLARRVTGQYWLLDRIRYPVSFDLVEEGEGGAAVFTLRSRRGSNSRWVLNVLDPRMDVRVAAAASVVAILMTVR